MDLHPAGAATFGERKRDVVTRGEYVAEGSRVLVVETHGNRIVVEKADAPQDENTPAKS